MNLKRLIPISGETYFIRSDKEEEELVVLQPTNGEVPKGVIHQFKMDEQTGFVLANALQTDTPVNSVALMKGAMGFVPDPGEGERILNMVFGHVLVIVDPATQNMDIEVGGVIDTYEVSEFQWAFIRSDKEEESLYPDGAEGEANHFEFKVHRCDPDTGQQTFYKISDGQVSVIRSDNEEENG